MIIQKAKLELQNQMFWIRVHESGPGADVHRALDLFCTCIKR